MFQANVISGNSLEFDALLYPRQHQNTLNFIKESIINIPKSLLESGTGIFQNAIKKYEEMNSTATMMRVMNALKSISNMKNENVIYPILNIENSQQATITMQRWIMAEPTIRGLYHEQRCDGFSDTYVDNEPDSIGENHYDYRRVMSGVVLYDDPKTMTKFYMDELKEGDRELTPFEKITIVNSWEIIKNAALAMKEDPTDPYGGSLS